jgi:dTMP kinase
MNNKPLFIVMDSVEGAGKTSQLNAIKEALGDRVLLTREPGGSPYAEEIRNLILKSPNAAQANAKTLFALFWASRADHLENTVKPALESGKIVISDRFDSSTFAYQIRGQEASELEGFFWQTRDFFLGDLKPDHYIYLDLDPVIGLARKSKQGEDEQNHFELKKIEFHNRMRSGFLEFLKQVPHTVIDASKSIEEVKKDILSCLSKLGVSV